METKVYILGFAASPNMVKVEVKCKLISSMFPEKIVFDKDGYRTNSYNKVLDLIYLQTTELNENKKSEQPEYFEFVRFSTQIRI